MAKSKFLPLQDIDGDQLIDACEEVVVIEEGVYCPPCTPNSAAIIPDWRKRTLYEPFLNGKNCMYQITVTADETSIGDLDCDVDGSTGLTEEEAAAALEELFVKYEDTAIVALLQVLGKDDSAETIDVVKQSIEHTDYWLSPRNKSHLKLLYSVPFEVIDSLSDALPEEEVEEEIDPTDIEVTYVAKNMDELLRKVRVSLILYSRYLKVLRAVNRSNILFAEDDRLFNLKNYGDMGVFGTSVMGNILPQLNAFLNKHGYSIPEPGSIKIFNSSTAITEITFTFSPEYALKKILFFTEGCDNVAVVFKDRLDDLRTQSSWKDPTAMAYFVQLDEMVPELTARIPTPWTEFIIKYTYPEVYVSDTTSYDEDESSCVGEALEAEAKQLGQDILDEVFSVGDAIAYKFHESACKGSLVEKTNEDIELGITTNPNSSNDTDPAQEQSNVYAMAQEQEYQSLETSSAPFESYCDRISNAGMSIGDMSFEKQLDEMWTEGFDDIKMCGLFDTFIQAMTSLMGGLTLEDALGAVTESGLRGMSINNFGVLYSELEASKQTEIEQLALKKLEEGEIFDDEHINQQISDAIGAGVSLVKPWTDDSLSEQEKTESPSAYGTFSEDTEIAYKSTRRTLAQRYDIVSGGTGSQLSVRIAMEAYINATIEVYQDDLLALLDELNKFPGAQLVANTILAVNCPTTPFLNPGVADFLHDIELPNPFCRDINDVTWPKLVNPFGWIPKISDILSALFEALKAAVQMAIMQILTQLLIKVCEIVGDAISNAVESGDITASLASGNSDMLRDMVKESICGEDADDETVDNAVVELVSSLGAGGAALADEEQTLAFAEDISSSLTQLEMVDAFLGNPSGDMLEIVDSLIEYEYSDYRTAIPNKEAISSFFKNIGNLMPAPFRSNLQDYAAQIPENDAMPANPTICADPELLEQFCELRSDLLCGRATAGQAREMCDNLQDQMKDDLGDLSSIMQNLDDFLESNMPPLVSDPGCDNGLLPYESEVASAAVAGGLGATLEQLKIDFLTDMLGTGPLPSDWGMLNMILSDTMGNPLTAHMLYVALKRNSVHPYVDFYGTWAPDQMMMLAMSALNPLYGVMAAPHMLQLQRGAFPTKVAAYLQNGISDIKSFGAPKIDLNNDWESDDSWTKTLNELGIFSGSFGSNVDLVAIPDLGYNVEMEPIINEDTSLATTVGLIEGVEFTLKGRKANPDVTLSFSDNAKGMVESGESAYSYGYDIYSYFGDLAENKDGQIANRPDDNVRIKINERLNMAANVNVFLEASESPHMKLLDEDATAEAILQSLVDGVGGIIADKIENVFDAGATAVLGSPEYDVIETLKYEFMGTDNTFDVVGEEFLNDYPNFLNSFQTKASYEPQTILLDEMLYKENNTAPGYNNIRAFRSEFVESTLDTFFKTVADVNTKEKSGWAYGATFDTLSPADFTYGITDPDDPTIFIPYFEANQSINGASEPYRERDMVLGISLNQHNTLLSGGTMDDVRVLYLDPATFGGNYLRPSFHVRQSEAEGWLGLIDAFFPESNPCEPKNADLIDFEQIQKMIDDLYPNIPEDERLKSDSTCALELPYNRILQRPAKAGMVGLITAAIRLYVCAHFIKGFPTFIKFAPRCPAVLSSVYASYIIEVMESHFKDAQPPLWELFNVFKDEEFWYAFLEQSVQMYAMLVDNGNIQEPPPAVLDALFRLNDLQAEYDYPFRDDLLTAKLSGDAGLFQTLGGYRLDKNLEAVRSTEEDAKIILKELVVEQINFMADKFVNNMSKFGWNPEVHDMAYYLLEEMVVESTLTLNKAVNPDGSFTTNYADIGTETTDAYGATKYYYTYGGEFVVKEDRDETGLRAGEEYVGYYHVTLDENGNLMWMAGQQHTEEPHDILYPLVHKMSVPIGDVPEWVHDDQDKRIAAATEGPFILEKYISIDGQRKAPTTAYDLIRSDSTNNISDVYPGTLKIVNDENGNPVGLSGKLGVRYGLLFSIVIDGTKYEVTSVELDALDLPLNQFSNLEGDSKLLLCLASLLKNDKKFKLMSEYIFPLNKLVGLTAIYNDMGILPSIGELTVERNQTFWNIINPNPLKSTRALLKRFDYSAKPGLQVELIKEALIDPETGKQAMVGASVQLPAEPYPFPWSASYINRDDLTEAETEYQAQLQAYDDGDISWLELRGSIVDINDYTVSVDDEGRRLTNEAGKLYDGDRNVVMIPYTDEIPIEIVTGATLDTLPGAPDGAWAAFRDRLPETTFNPLAGFGVVEYDFWSQEILRNARSRIKKLFMSFYGSKQLKPNMIFEGFDSPSEIIAKKLRKHLRPDPGLRQVPWWMRGRLRTNPFDADGNVCEIE